MEKTTHKHTVSSFDAEMKNISSRITAMSDLVVSLLDTFLSAINDPASQDVAKVKSIDVKVNGLEKEVEKFSTNLIALRNPMAIDLRYLISSIKISTIIERQGDMIESAVKKLIKVDDKSLVKVSGDLIELTKLCHEMINVAVKGFCEQDTTSANKVWRMEDKADDMADELFGKIKNEIKNNPANVEDFVSLMLIARGLERFADYCTKITKTVHYVASGERVSEGDF